MCSTKFKYSKYTMKLLDIVIVNWNTSSLLRNCLDSIYHAKHLFRIIVVDNASCDDSVSMVRNIYPEVVLHVNQNNEGYAKANNLGISLGSSSFICLLNSDTVVNVDVLLHMVQYLNSHPKVVACGPALRLPSGKLQTGGAGYKISVPTAFNYFFFLSRLFPLKFKGMYIDQAYFVARGQPVKVDWLAGACLLVLRRAVERVGALDESYFMYAEDAEWCDRLSTYGELHYLPNLEILHIHGASSTQIPTAPSVQWLVGTFKYFLMVHGNFKLIVFKIIMMVGFFVRMLLYFLASPVKKGSYCRALTMRHYLIHVTSSLFS